MKFKKEQENQDRTDAESPKSKGGALALSNGGFSVDTHVFTQAGAVPVVELSVGTLVYALDPTTKLIKLKPVTAVERVSSNSSLVTLETRRADIRVSPSQRIPYCTKSRSAVQFKQARELDEQSYYKFVNDWRRLPGTVLETVDITDFVDDYEICASCEAHGHTVRAALPEGCEPVRNNGHTGYHFDAETFKRYQSEIEAIAEEVTIRHGLNHHRRPYRFTGDDFIQFIGWFVTEGSVYWSSSSDTAQVKLAQENESYRESIAALLERMGIKTYTNERGSSFGSKVFGCLLEDLCGRGSHHKHLPSFVWDLSEDQQRLLLQVLLWGDGNERQTYYTVSDRLAMDILRLCVELGFKPRYTRRRNTWQIYV